MFCLICLNISLGVVVELERYLRMETEIIEVTEKKKYEIKFVKPMVLLALFIATGVLTGIYCMIFEHICASTYWFSEF